MAARHCQQPAGRNAAAGAALQRAANDTQPRLVSLLQVAAKETLLTPR